MVVLPGCAGPHAAARAPATATAAATTKASALTFAHAVNLRASDEPAMEALGPERAAPSPDASEFAFTRCDGGISPARILANIRSTLLSAGRDGEWRLARSRVTLMPSEALARRNLAAFASARGVRCARRYGGTSISSRRVALAGGAYAFGQHIIAASRGSTHVLGYHDILGFVRGPAEIVLTAAGFSHPLASRTEQRLLNALYRRAAQAQLP
jgi:hypothetical protein